MKQYIALIPIIILAACANPSIVKVSPDTYVLYKEDHGGIFGNAAKLRAKVIQEANDFAAEQGKIAIPVSSDFKPMGNGPAQWASYEYQFRVVDKNDEEAVRTSIRKDPDEVTEHNINIVKKIERIDEDPDLHEELIKLKELLDKDIISKEEFDKLKANAIERKSK